MLAIYKRVSEKEIKKDAKELLKRSKDFFDKNPKRRVANVQVWYGKMVKVRKSHIEEDVQKAVDDAT